jgi:TolB protein
MGLFTGSLNVSGTGWNGSPKWSAEGKQIVYYSSEFGSPREVPLSSQPSGIMVMSADGSNQRAVTAWETSALSPEFRPDGRIIYARKNKQNREEIDMVNPDGSGERIVESDESNNSY